MDIKALVDKWGDILNEGGKIKNQKLWHSNGKWEGVSGIKKEI